MTAAVPDTLDVLLTPEWLTSALTPRFPGIEVVDVTPGPIISRLSTNARFHIETADPLPDGLRSDLCAKGYFTEAGWPFRHIGESEVSFYRDIAAATDIRTLRSVYADIDPTTRHGVVITEDVVAQGATFLDALSDYTPDQAAESLTQLAKLHASSCNHTAYADAEWLAPKLGLYQLMRGVDEIRGNFDGPIGARVPEAVRDAEALADAFRVLALTTAEAPTWSIIHGDAHVGNLFLDADDRPAFCDWQIVQRGPWYLDVGYHLASGLTVEDRRNHEDELVRHYLDDSRAAGAEAPSLDDAWLGVRRGIVYGFFLWGITLKVEPPVTTALLERLGTAASDHDAYASVHPTT